MIERALSHAIGYKSTGIIIWFIWFCYYLLRDKLLHLDSGTLGRVIKLTDIYKRPENEVLPF